MYQIEIIKYLSLVIFQSTIPTFPYLQNSTKRNSALILKSKLHTYLGITINIIINPQEIMHLHIYCILNKAILNKFFDSCLFLLFFKQHISSLI